MADTRWRLFRVLRLKLRAAALRVSSRCDGPRLGPVESSAGFRRRSSALRSASTDPLQCKCGDGYWSSAGPAVVDNFRDAYADSDIRITSRPSPQRPVRSIRSEHIPVHGPRGGLDAAGRPGVRDARRGGSAMGGLQAHQTALVQDRAGGPAGGRSTSGLETDRQPQPLLQRLQDGKGYGQRTIRVAAE